MALFAARISSYRRVKPSGILMKWVTSVSLSPATTSRRRYLPSPSCRSGRSYTNVWSIRSLGRTSWDCSTSS